MYHKNLINSALDSESKLSFRGTYVIPLNQFNFEPLNREGYLYLNLSAFICVNLWLMNSTFYNIIKNNKANFISQGVFLFYFIGLKL